MSSVSYFSLYVSCYCKTPSRSEEFFSLYHVPLSSPSNPTLKNCSLLKGLPDTIISPYPKGEMCYLFCLIFAFLSFSEKVLSGFYLIDVMSYARTFELLNLDSALLLWDLKMIHSETSYPQTLKPLAYKFKRHV